MKKILLSCYEVVGYGGAATSTYSLFQYMQDKNLDVCLVNFIESIDIPYYQYSFGVNFGNPKLLNNVYNCAIDVNFNKQDPRVVELLNKLKPDVAIGVGNIAPLILKRALPDLPVIFLASGCSQAEQTIIREKGLNAIDLSQRLQQAKEKPKFIPHHELNTIKLANLVITHSEMIQQFYRYFFPSYVGKFYDDIIWFAEWIYGSAAEFKGTTKLFEEREIDVIFIASDWSRPVKNYNFVQEIVAQLQGINVHVVGNAKHSLRNVTYHGIISQQETLFTLLGNVKTVVSTSIFDAAPGILFEASALGCNIVTSKNCGNWQLCHETLLVDPFTVSNFVQKIRLSVEKKYSDNIEYFFKTKSLDNLIETALII